MPNIRLPVFVRVKRTIYHISFSLYFAQVIGKVLDILAKELTPLVFKGRNRK